MEALLQKHTQRDQHRMASKAFITFKSFTPATIARQVMHSANPGYMKLSEAPEPSDIHWENINMNSRKAKVRHYFGVVLYILIVIGYVIPVTLISDVTSETYLRDQYAWIDSICSNTIVASAVDLIQPCSLLMLMITIPPIFRLMGFMEGHMTESAINNQMLSRYYTFLIVNVLLVVSLAGSVVTSIDEIVTDPVAFFESLGAELPKVAGTSRDYVLIKGLLGAGAGDLALHQLADAPEPAADLVGPDAARPPGRGPGPARLPGPRVVPLREVHRPGPAEHEHHHDLRRHGPAHPHPGPALLLHLAAHLPVHAAVHLRAGVRVRRADVPQGVPPLGVRPVHRPGRSGGRLPHQVRLQRVLRRPGPLLHHLLLQVQDAVHVGAGGAEHAAGADGVPRPAAPRPHRGPGDGG
ncbi:unnamed protein product [Heterosigma akashiwo]